MKLILGFQIICTHSIIRHKRTVPLAEVISLQKKNKKNEKNNITSSVIQQLRTEHWAECVKMQNERNNK